MRPQEIAIIGAGNGGTAAAGDLALAGHRIRLFEFPEWVANIAPIQASRQIRVTGIARTGTAQVALATTDLAEALDGATLVLVATQSLAHERVARALAPLLVDGQVVALFPGSGGTLVFSQVFHELGFDRRIVLGESVTFPYCCRRLAGPGTVNIHRIDGPQMLTAALPASDTPRLFAALEGTYADRCAPAESVIEPAVYNPNIVAHPVGGIFNMGRIELTNGDFWMYKEGFTPSVKKIIYTLDLQRMQVMAALGYDPHGYDWIFKNSYGTDFEGFVPASSKGPFSMQDRYISEDVPVGMVLTASLGRKVGVPTPTYDAIIEIASVVNDRDFYAEGRSLENLGLADLTVDDLRAFFKTGRRP
jgi:opine dehydrogenase